jgi:hypothetical protein
MAPARSRVQQFFLQSIVPILCSIAVGYAFHQDRVFDHRHGAFQFVWSAVLASLFYYFLFFLRLRDALLGFILLFLLTFITTESTRPAFILRDIFYVGGIGVSIYLYFTHFHRGSTGNDAYTPLMLAGMYAVVSIIASAIYTGMLRTFAMEDTGGTLVSLASTSAYFGVLIGFAVGCGIRLNERIAEMQKSTGKRAATR